jgi:hypothetical protein
VSYLIAVLAALAALVAAFALAGQSQSAQAQAAPARLLDRSAELALPDDTAVTLAQDKTVAARSQLAFQRAREAITAATYTVRAGDSLSAVAADHCGPPRDWTGIYAASRARGWTARNANDLTAGQHLFLACSWVPAELKFAPEPPPPPRPAVQVLTHVQHSAVVHIAVAAPAYVSSGIYSYGALEALWVSAGGPAWAASHAAEIAECESGGNPSAYNPSGATGLWQILGSVVPGNLDNPFTNALNAVAKFRASGGTFAQWVCT